MDGTSRMKVLQYYISVSFLGVSICLWEFLFTFLDFFVFRVVFIAETNRDAVFALRNSVHSVYCTQMSNFVLNGSDSIDKQKEQEPPEKTTAAATTTTKTTIGSSTILPEQLLELAPWQALAPVEYPGRQALSTTEQAGPPWMCASLSRWSPNPQSRQWSRSRSTPGSYCLSCYCQEKFLLTWEYQAQGEGEGYIPCCPSLPRMCHRLTTNNIMG